ncbi:MAG: 50S ribosomal protein L21 [bacterium]
MKEKFAVIQLGGSQHIVKIGDSIQVNRLEGKAGDTVKIEEVLLYNDGDNVLIGDPFVPYVVELKIDKNIKDKKIDIIKYKAKSRYRKKIGHRQLITLLTVKKITKKSSK